VTPLEGVPSIIEDARRAMAADVGPELAAHMFEVLYKKYGLRGDAVVVEEARKLLVAFSLPWPPEPPALTEPEEEPDTLGEDDEAQPEAADEAPPATVSDAVCKQARKVYQRGAKRPPWEKDNDSTLNAAIYKECGYFPVPRYITQAVFNELSKSPGLRRVLDACLAAADKRGQFEYPAGTLADDTELHRTNAQKHLATLLETRLIRVMPGFEGSAKVPNVYTLATRQEFDEEHVLKVLRERRAARSEKANELKRKGEEGEAA
jgi:hypothetical protein